MTGDDIIFDTSRGYRIAIKWVLFVFFVLVLGLDLWLWYDVHGTIEARMLAFCTTLCLLLQAIEYFELTFGTLYQVKVRIENGEILIYESNDLNHASYVKTNLTLWLDGDNTFESDEPDAKVDEESIEFLYRVFRRASFTGLIFMFCNFVAFLYSITYFPVVIYVFGAASYAIGCAAVARSLKLGLNARITGKTLSVHTFWGKKYSLSLDQQACIVARTNMLLIPFWRYKIKANGITLDLLDIYNSPTYLPRLVERDLFNGSTLNILRGPKKKLAEIRRRRA